MTRLVTLDEAVSLIKSGQLVAMPTETVYGLAADATDDQAVARIYALKNRPVFNPLIVHVPDVESAQQYAEFSELALQCVAAFWPGALTLILPLKKKSGLSKLVTAGLDTVALRVPNHSVALALLKQTQRPLAAPSANPSGRLSPTSVIHVAELFKDTELAILDGQVSAVGLESTILDLSTNTPVVLRYGGLSIDSLRSIIPDLNFAEASDKIKAPGQLLRHYAPRHTLRMNVTEVHEGEALLAFGQALPTQCPVLNLSPKGDLVEAASRLFLYLHQLDALDNVTGIAVMPIPETGLGYAINDRLKRGAERDSNG